MSVQILEEARLFLVHSLQGKRNSNESRHPWRRSWEFAVLHSLRVEAYTTKIVQREQHPISEHEVILLRLAAILHDVARLDRREDHAQRGAQISETWLTKHSGDFLQSGDIIRVVNMIADHSNKGTQEPDFCKAVLKDADTLDEIGIMSVFMAGNWVEDQSPFFFYDLQQRLIDFELPFCEQKLGILNTNGAREILREKKAFIQSCIAQITKEIQADEYIEKILFESSQ